jgi:hypothetical protein
MDSQAVRETKWRDIGSLTEEGLSLILRYVL